MKMKIMYMVISALIVTRSLFSPSRVSLLLVLLTAPRTASYPLGPLTLVYGPWLRNRLRSRLQRLHRHPPLRRKRQGHRSRPRPRRIRRRRGLSRRRRRIPVTTLERKRRRPIIRYSSFCVVLEPLLLVYGIRPRRPRRWRGRRRQMSVHGLFADTQWPRRVPW